MKILIVGSGAREHALAWRVAASGHTVFAAPGNVGIARLATCEPIPATDVAQMVAFAKAGRFDLVVIGPEAPLVAGLADALRREGIPVFGPNQGAAAIEGSKAFAKELMLEAGVPTARAELFDDPERAERYAGELPRAVIKADGLAAGKGVVVSSSAEEARETVRSFMREGALGVAGGRILIEEFLEGEELSVIALCDGERYLLMPPARDHKRLLDDDLGPNTGGMGAFSPVAMPPEVSLASIGEQVIAPTLAALSRRGTPFVGALYAGLMMTAKGPMVLEYNARFGDPETQPLMMRLRGDFAQTLMACAAGDLRGQSLQVRSEAAVGVVLAAHGYPVKPRQGDLIEGLHDFEESDEVRLFHAGTRACAERVGEYETAGGRVLTLCALGKDVAHAKRRAYELVDQLSFAGMQYRRDIAAR